MTRRLVLAVTALCACSNQDQDGAEALWDEIQAADYHAWTRAPGYPGPTPSATVHREEVEIFLNEVIAEAVAAGEPLTAWPDGSLIVKDGLQGGAIEVVLAMEKRGGEWFFAEYHADGEVAYSGSPRACTRCHGDGDDGVLAFQLP